MGKDDSSKQAVGAGKVAPEKSKNQKKEEGEESPLAVVVAAKAALKEAQKARNEAQEQVDVLSMQIFQLYGNVLAMRLVNPGRRL